MKTIAKFLQRYLTTFTGALALSAPSFALNQAQLGALDQADHLLREFEDLDLQYVYVNLEYGNNTLNLAKPMGACRNSQYFKKTTGSSFAYKLEEQARLLEEKALAQHGDLDSVSETYILRADRLRKMKKAVIQSFMNSKLSLCAEYSVPAYSDGNEEYFYKVDGKLAIVLTVGRPD
jgi:hypothetical protein